MLFKNFLWKIINSIQQLSLVPTRIRMSLLRKAGFKLHASAKIASNVFIGSNQVSLGERAFVNIHCFLDGNGPIIIGDFVNLGPFVKLITGTHTINDDVMRLGGISESINLPIEIKRGCWIGAGTIILPGITIEEGCVVGAGSVVTRSTEPNGLYIGAPARRVKNLLV